MDNIKDLKTTAKEAKTRFKRGFWKEFNKTKEIKINEATERGYSLQEAIKLQSEKAKREIKIKFDKKSDEDILYDKVVEILSSNEIILNPIKRLVNDDVYDNLAENEKQLYILKLTEKFNVMKEKYNKEKFLS